MKTFQEFLAEAKQQSGGKEEYQTFFMNTLKKFGVNEPDQLEADKKREFFDYIDANWKADEESDKDEPLKEDYKTDTLKYIEDLKSKISNDDTKKFLTGLASYLSDKGFLTNTQKQALGNISFKK